MNEDLLNIVKIIRAKMNMIIFALFISTSMIAGWSVVQLFIEQPYLEQTDEMLERVARDDLKLLGIVNDIRYDIIQVQQYLTDISATRGLDGLDDGFEQAALYAKDLKKAVAEAHEIAAAFAGRRQAAQRRQGPGGRQHRNGVGTRQPGDLAIVGKERFGFHPQLCVFGDQDGERQLAQRSVGDDQQAVRILPSRPDRRQDDVV